MKRLLSAILIIVLALMLVTCGGREETTTGVGVTETEKLQAGAPRTFNSIAEIMQLGRGSPCNWMFKRTKKGKAYAKYHQLRRHKALAVAHNTGSAGVYYDGVATWGWPTKLKARAVALKRCGSIYSTRCTIYDVDGNVCGRSGGGTLKVTTPNGGQKWSTGKEYTLKWNKGNAGSFVKIELLKSGKAYKTIIVKTKNDGRHRWEIPSSVPTGRAYKIKVTSVSKQTVKDQSDNNFTITKTSTTSSESSSGGERPEFNDR
jgi:hypothetical protein